MISKLKYLIFVLIILFNGCFRSTEWEEITVDYDPELNIMGIISLDDNIESFVGVYRTTQLDETSMIFTGIVDTNWWYDEEYDTLYTWLDSLYEPAGIIDSAIVTISSEDETFNFTFDSYSRKYTNNNFIPKPETNYSLIVEANGFDLATGNLITPSAPNFNTSSLADTLPSNSTYEISWENNQSSATYGLLTGTLISNYSLCGGEFKSLIEFDWESFLVFPEWCDQEVTSIGDIDNDYGIMTQNECICDFYRVWDENNEICICDDNNPPILQDDNEAVAILGGCETAIENLQDGCFHQLENSFLIEYCPVSCGGCETLSNIPYLCDEGLDQYCPETCQVCDSDITDPIDNRNWQAIDMSDLGYDFEFGIDFYESNLGFCGDGIFDLELLQIRLIAMDENYYQYFASEDFRDFSNFLLSSDGTNGQSIGINGGFGVFGSFASQTIHRLLISD